MAKPAVILVGADKGGVGKTTVSRALLDYFIAHNVPTRAFDTESPKGTLKRFHPELTEVVDMHSTADQMKIFDTLSNTDAQVTVIDIRAGLLSTTLKSLRDIGFLDAAKKAQLTFTVFHILGPSIASLAEIDETAGFMDDAHYILVKNFINNTTFFEWDPATYNSYFNKIKDAHDITIPKLNEMACEQVEVAARAVRVVRRQQGGRRRGRQFLVRAARLCPALARQCVGRVRPREADRHGDAGAQAKGRRAAGLRHPRPMQRRTPIFIVTSSRPRVGKTLIARALTEYFLAQGRPVTAFDVNPDDFKLVDHLPAYTAAASIDDTRGEMALFDQLAAEDEVPKVVDLGHYPFERFFTLMREIDLGTELRRRAIAPMVLYVADPHERAQQGYATLKDRFPDLALVPLFNEYVPQIARCRDNFPPTRFGGEPVDIPALTPVVRSVVDRKNFSFLAYVLKTQDSTSELYQWMARVFVAFRELEVRLLLGEAAPQLRHSA